jgi:hypothetical protein
MDRFYVQHVTEGEEHYRVVDTDTWQWTYIQFEENAKMAAALWNEKPDNAYMLRRVWRESDGEVDAEMEAEVDRRLKLADEALVEHLASQGIMFPPTPLEHFNNLMKFAQFETAAIEQEEVRKMADAVRDALKKGN